MDRKNAWIIGGSVLLGFVVFGLSQVVAQRFGPPDGERPGPAQVGRYQVVRATAEVIIIMDTVTGELYSPDPGDIKPYSARPRPGFQRPPFEEFKEKVAPLKEKVAPPVKERPPFDFKKEGPPIREKVPGSEFRDKEGPPRKDR